MITDTGTAAAIRAAFVDARTPRDLAKACDDLMDVVDEPEDLETLRRKREAALLADLAAPAAKSCACGFGPILAEVDRRIAQRILVGARAATLVHGTNRYEKKLDAQICASTALPLSQDDVAKIVHVEEEAAA